MKLFSRVLNSQPIDQNISLKQRTSVNHGYFGQCGLLTRMPEFSAFQELFHADMLLASDLVKYVFYINSSFFHLKVGVLSWMFSPCIVILFECFKTLCSFVS